MHFNNEILEYTLGIQTIKALQFFNPVTIAPGLSIHNTVASKEAGTGRARSILARAVTAGSNRTTARNHAPSYKLAVFLFLLAAKGLALQIVRSSVLGEVSLATPLFAQLLQTVAKK